MGKTDKENIYLLPAIDQITHPPIPFSSRKHTYAHIT